MVNRLPGYKQPISGFNLSHSFNYTTNFGYAVPILCKEFVPGDIMKISYNDLVRMTPLQTPTMSDIYIRIDAFRVDNNIIWPEFLDFIKQTGSEENPITAPYITIPENGFGESTLADYLGIPPGTGEGVKVSALPFRAYTKCINDYYLNSNIDEELPLSTASGEDTTTNTTLQKIRWSRSKDRFVSALAEPQRGDDVILPVATSAPVVGNGTSLGFTDGTNNAGIAMGSGSNMDVLTGVYGDAVGSTDYTGTGLTYKKALGITTDPTKSGLTVDLSSSSGVSLRAFRLAERLQQFRELSLMAGDRYVEWQKAFWAVPSSDARLQRAEWLGGFKQPMIVSEVLQNSETSTTPQGTMAGHGFSVGQGGLTLRVNEYGFVVLIMSIMPKADYQQGLDKMFSRFSNFDYANPMFSHLSFQEIKEKELYLQDADVTELDGSQSNDKAFGFEPIFNEYRLAQNRVSGSFRSSLKQWLLTRIFDAEPKLNTAFIEGNPSNRIFAVESDEVDKLYCSVRFNIKAIRHLPRIGMPAL